MNAFNITDEQVATFHEDGFLVVPGLLSDEETNLLHRIGRGDREIQNIQGGRLDAKGGVSRLLGHNALHDDMYSAIVRSERIVNTMEKLLDDEVYHFHHKMMVKDPRIGGAWEWHQDYGYWYRNNHCLWPDMASCMIALDRATKENGCLQVIRGSNRCGRLEHGQVADQTGADLKRVEALLERLELVYPELDPGDALFFHCNTLHRSDQNRSDKPRWALICCYNTKHNDPYIYKETSHPPYSYLEKWPDDRVLEVGRQQWQQMQAAGASS